MLTKNLRPRQAAAYLGIGESTLWAKSRTDPDFPPLIKLSSRITVMTQESLDHYVEVKAKQSHLNAGKAASA
jgi:predicted DNA-binding transcriptional regulator AlpA